MPLSSFNLNNIRKIAVQAIKNNFWYKIIAVLIALMAWVYIAVEENARVTIDVRPQVEYESKEGFIMVGDLQNVAVSLWGPKDAVRNIGPAQIKVYVNIDEPEKGENEYILTADNVLVSEREKIKVLGIEPEKITIKFQKYK